jgi:hypothetical protein
MKRVHWIGRTGARIVAVGMFGFVAAATPATARPGQLSMAQARSTARQIARKDAFAFKYASWRVACLRVSPSTAHCKIFLTNDQGNTCYTLVRISTTTTYVYSRYLSGGDCGFDAGE